MKKMAWLLTVSVVLAGLLLVTKIVVPASKDTVVKEDSRSSATRASLPESEKVSSQSAIPLSASQLDGWRGVRLAGVFDNNRFYCLPEFPKKFGLRDKREMDLLLLLIRHDPSFKSDVECYVDSSAVALRHLFQLASEHRDAGAARRFVMPKGIAVLNLDGELAEQYVFDYRPKVLMKFQNLRNIVPERDEVALAEEVCQAARSDAFLEGAGIGPVIENLKRNGMGSLAGKILRECGTK